MACSAPICRCVHYTFATFVHNYNFRYSLASTYGNTAFVYTVSINIYNSKCTKKEVRYRDERRSMHLSDKYYILIFTVKYISVIKRQTHIPEHKTLMHFSVLLFTVGGVLSMSPTVGYS